MTKRRRVRNAYYRNRKYLDLVFQIQQEFARRAIHEKLTPGKATKAICAQKGGYITCGTVKRFFNYGDDGKRYTYTRGPYMTTTAAIADVLGFELRFLPKE